MGEHTTTEKNRIRPNRMDNRLMRFPKLALQYKPKEGRRSKDPKPDFWLIRRCLNELATGVMPLMRYSNQEV
jgi:hypothetical protein